MALRMEPGQTYDSWSELKEALDIHCEENKVIFNIANAKTVEAANAVMKKGPYYDPRLKYAHCILQCKHYGSYTSSSAGLRPKQRSYKINCRAFISVSACRKENYLIVRDSYHKHSHPCTEEIYNSYPEVRRMTKDERRMVGHLLDLGVPISQIKTAVGRNVTPKDLHNAKIHIKAVKMGLKDEEPKGGPKRRRTYKELEKARQEAIKAAGDEITDSEEESNSGEIDTKTVKNSQNEEGMPSQSSLSFMHDSQESIQEDPKKDFVEKVSHESRTYLDPENPSSVIVGTVNDEKEDETGEMNGLSGLLAAAGSVDALDTGPEEDTSTGSKTSYTVIVTSDGNMEMAQTSSNLQDLLKKVEVERILKTKAGKSLIDTKDQSHQKSDDKNCADCGKYMSPLDGHSLCIACLGPQHLHARDCEHCAEMKPEQLNIRRKVFVRMRMKALKEMNNTKRQNGPSPGTSSQMLNTDDHQFQARRSKRARKPKDFGPEMAVQTLLGQRLVSQNFPTGSKTKVTKCVVNDGEKEYLVEIPKHEPDEDYSSSLGMTDGSDMLTKSVPHNTLRFEHLLKQTVALDDVSLTHCANGALGFIPDSEITTELSKTASHSDVSSIPQHLLGKYHLDSQFESTYCSIPVTLDPLGDSTVMSMGTGLHKLAQNAVVQTRLAVYDKLFTKLGIGMADEALGILSQLCGKVTQVTEISQEDLTNDLQTALDTIHALKDVLEELGVMSKDALSTAAHQRNISVNSIEKAKSSLKSSFSSTADQTPTKRRKFQPFSRSKVVNPPAVNSETTVDDSIIRNDSNEAIKVENLASSEANHVVMNVSSLPPVLTTQGMTSVLTVSTPQSELNSISEVPTTFIDVANKHYTIAPTMSLSGELLETLQNQKDGIIELHVVKNAEELVTSQGASIVHEVIQSPSLEVGVAETSNVECE